MKILLTVLASMMITGTALAACSKPQDCQSEADCTELGKSGAAKYTWNASASVKCMVVDTSVATKCVDNNDGKRDAKVVDTAAPKDAAAGAETKTK